MKTLGTRIAEEVRQKTNNLTREERDRLYMQGLSRIYAKGNTACWKSKPAGPKT